MHEEWEKEKSYQRRNDHSRPKSKWVWGLERKEYLGGEMEGFYRERLKIMRLDFALDLFRKNASRWIKNLSRFCRALILDRWICRGAIKNLSMAKYLDRSRSYWEPIGQIETFSMDRESVEKLLRQIPESFNGSKIR